MIAVAALIGLLWVCGSSADGCAAATANEAMTFWSQRNLVPASRLILYGRMQLVDVKAGPIDPALGVDRSTPHGSRHHRRIHSWTRTASRRRSQSPRDRAKPDRPDCDGAMSDVRPHPAPLQFTRAKGDQRQFRLAAQFRR